MAASETLHFTIVQANIRWEDKAANLAHYDELIASIEGAKEVVLLPEMFSTGFSMAAAQLAERMDGPTVDWMRSRARQHRIILAGSLIIEEDGKYYNRMVWMQPDGNLATYDKRHLFGYAEEDEHYAPGDRRLIVSVNGWKLCLLVCYDLRFPVWSRNLITGDEPMYDALVYVANWPRRRSVAWKTLLQARAIENQCFCIGVNRVGDDGAGINYEGASSVFDPLGELLWQHSETEAVHTVALSRKSLEETRSHLPFLKDGDRFAISG